MIDPISAATPPTPNPAAPRNAAEAAQQFEALLIAQLLQAAQPEDADAASDTMWSVAAQQFSKVMAEQGGFGIGRMIRNSLPK